MDLLTQLDNDIDLLLKIMSSSIAYISRKAKHAPLPDSTIPLTVLGKTEAVSAVELDASISELVADLVDKADSIREIIEHLPTEASLGGDTELQHQLMAMQSELQTVNKSYMQLSTQVDSLSAEVRELLGLLTQSHSDARRWLVDQLDAQCTPAPISISATDA
ncbi:uncharacterized protein UMAG_11681 [Mycosarcoma maydis]|uniref:Mediator of RNA polymerase II transcription subunit 21 n=1 Tax=Mycosarcoma maydis TaxID=5270 RepID=A0A0D1CVF9_MYCMD|nr:uncharacterized protein UMAG_11681 [Ustilago maydis 521]KIS70403.1 hypothetical protein UMAG_11681 [Ustilago maydis 521]|eukprot:XP_011388075.1 hypothetical protein UMAG_11681 [Ustilago maydis 521]